ncbi:hypothetical protein FANTH_3307 [Fusarium anthophilum]|uniref:Thioesterase domain-containing protein n=1 Tax=Fusarium anthophilum TaxID=48485 RepID=A0A8H4ZRZ5_9HYPO|nr:hypothetical protein FANTH_3307 [Fusarium anthophilum]
MNNNASDLHHFLKVPWCAETLTAPDIKLLHEIQNPLGTVMNRGAFANGILAIPDGVRAQLAYFHQKPQESRPIGAPFPELCVMYDIGPGVAGWAGRGHGGFLSYLFDTVAGWLALLNTHHAGKVQGTPQIGEPTTMTARLEVNYRKPIVLDGVFIVTATIKQLEGKKILLGPADIWWLALNKVRLLGEVYSNDYKEAEPLANLWLQTALQLARAHS